MVPLVFSMLFALVMCLSDCNGNSIHARLSHDSSYSLDDDGSEPTNNSLFANSPPLSCSTLKQTFIAVTEARQILQCGSSGPQLRESTSCHKGVIESVKSCADVDESAACLLKSVVGLDGSQCSMPLYTSYGPVRTDTCDSLMLVEDSLKTTISLLCHEARDNLFGSQNCGFCSTVVEPLLSVITVACCDITSCFLLGECLVLEALLGAHAGCIPCVCEALRSLGFRVSDC